MSLARQPREHFTGEHIGRWTLLARVDNVDRSPSLPKGRRAWLCKCECGTMRPVSERRLRSGRSQSCGCLNRQLITKHGNHRSPTYVSWSAMRGRCGNANDPSFERYGGRGIRVCAAWDSFATFLADMGERPSGTSIDRIDPDGNYEPGNCRWATRSQQAKNRRPFAIGKPKGA